MAGHLQTHPYYKSFDELQRTEKRMTTYLEIHGSNLPLEEVAAIKALIKAVQDAIKCIPFKYHITRHKQRSL